MDRIRAKFQRSSEATNSPFPGFVSLDRQLLLATLIGGLLFLWPLLTYGRPGYLQDSAAYYKGGHVAVSFIAQKLHLEAPAKTPVPTTASSRVSQAAALQPAAAQQVRGARSVAYSVTAYVLGAPRPQMWLLAAAQAFLTAFACSIAFLLFGEDLRMTAGKLAALAFMTPVAFAVCRIIPDIFAALTILVITLLATSYRSLSSGVRVSLALVGAAAVTFHASDPPIAVGVTVLAAALILSSARATGPAPITQWAYLIAPLLLGVTISLSLNSVAFGGTSLTGKRFPLTLARSVAEGPARLYLDRNCGHLKYAVCEVYPHGVPRTLDGFLWSKTGISRRATPQQLERIRAEEPEVVLAATRAYPWLEIKRLSIQFGRQLVHFEPGEGLWDRLVYDADGNPVREPVSFDSTWVAIVGLLSIASALASIALLLFRWRCRPELRAMMTLVVFGILLNAAICVYFSGITNRYQERVIWLISLLALMAIPRVGGRGDESQRGLPE